MEKIKAVILKNESADDHYLWVLACQDRAIDIDYRIVDLTSSSWFEQIQSQPFDILLAKPGGLSAPFKQLYDERIYILGKILAYPVFPSADEIFIYENKRFLAYWLKANHIPHPPTYIFYDQEEAIDFSKHTPYPLAAKTNLGASGSGVTILKNEAIARKYISDIFSKKGAWQRWGPNFGKGNILKRGLHYVINPGVIRKKLDVYNIRKNDIQKGFVLFQKFIPHEFEWRIVAIGDSYFAHKKLKISDKASGSTLKNYDNPPISLFEFAKEIMDRFGFYSQAIDVFETSDGQLLINEMQCIFGQSDEFQMLVNGIPGRYRSIHGSWVFEPGNYNANESYNLRIDQVIKLFAK